MSSIIIIIILLLILYYINKDEKIHNFWNKQPVMRTYTSKWVNMNQLPIFNIIIPDNMKIKYDIDINDAIKFVNDNFSAYVVIGNDNMKKYLSDINVTNVGIYKDDNIIGFIHSRPLKILYDNDEKLLNYVEYLCVSKDMRGCNIASILISSLINRMNEINDDISRVYLFKKDGRGHSFLPFISSKYLCLDLKSVKNNKYIDDDDVYVNSDISLNYNEWMNKTNMYKISRIMDETEWNDEVKIKDRFIINIDDNSYIIIGQSSRLKGNINNNVFDIEYIYNTKYTNDKRYNWELWMTHLVNKGYDYITVNDIANYREIIPNIDEWADGNSFEYYLYNGECEKIENKDIYFTL
jgi:hypothetical protein